MRIPAVWCLCLLSCLAGTTRASAQADTSAGRADTAVTHVLRLRDGSVLMGRVLSRDATTLRFETHGSVIAIPTATIAELTLVKAADVHGEEYWFPDPNRTRLFFAPTGRMLDQGEGYYSNTYLLLQNFATGATKNVTLGGGFSIVPSDDFISNNVYYLTPKVGLVQSEKTNIAVGALVGFAPVDNGQNFGILYGVATQGGADGNVTAGLGYAYANGDLNSTPIFMLGGVKRMSRRSAFVTENYGFVDNGTLDTGISYGLRFMGEKLSVDFALWNSLNDSVFPGIPYIAFAVKF